MRAPIAYFVLTILLISAHLDALGSPGSDVYPEPTIIDTSIVADPYSFAGLASYYNAVQFLLVDSHEVQPASQDGVVKTLKKNEWLVAAGRFNARVFKAPGLRYDISDGELRIHDITPLHAPASLDRVVLKSELQQIAPELDGVRYAHLWFWLAGLSRLTESSLLALRSHTSIAWGVTIILFAFLLKIILLPVSVVSARLQRKTDLVTSELAPKLADIKSKFRGEEAHQRIMAAHKEAGVTPFYTLKPMLGTLIQIPILIAVFNALGEMPQLQTSSLLWIGSLSYPDAVATLPFSPPLLGPNVSVLPVLMACTMLLASKGPAKKRSAISGINYGYHLFTFAVFLLLYPFPAGMVLYWSTNNLFQFFERTLLER